MALRAGVYTRLSKLKETKEQTRLAMERQDEDSMRVASDRAYEVVKTYPDPGISADDTVVREVFEGALRDLAEGTIDVLIIPKFDRMTRGLGTWLRVERVLLDNPGRLLVSAADGDLDPSDPASKFMLRQRAQMAEYELDQIKARVRRWHKQRAEHGWPLVSGRRPFGYVDKQRSEVEPLEAAVIEYAAELLIHGKSLRSVTAWVNTVTTAPNGKPWRPPNLRAALTSPGVAGLRYYHGVEVATGRWTAILDRTTWQRLRAKLEANGAKSGRPTEHLLSGLLRCGRCGHPMHSTTLRDRKRGLPDRRQYACRKRPGQPNCGKLTITAEPVEAAVSAEVLAHLSPTALAAALASLGDDQATAAAAELNEAELARDEVEQMHTTGAIRRDAFLRMHGPAQARVDAAHKALRAASGRSALADLPTDPAELAAWWNDPTTTTADRRSVIEAALGEVTITPSGPRMNRFDAGRVVIPEESWKV
jgi:site-specific DNA recombinase